MTTDTEVALVQELRRLRKLLRSQIYNSPEFNYTLSQISARREELDLERWAKHRARAAVEFLNDKPGVDIAVFKAFKTVTIFFAIMLALWIWISGDLSAKTWGTGLIMFATGISFLFYFFGYLCQTRK